MIKTVIQRIMKKCWFHKWQEIRQKGKGLFLNEAITWDYVSFRQCRKCGKSQELNSLSGDSYYSTLSEQQTDILNRAISSDNNFFRVDRKSVK